MKTSSKITLCGVTAALSTVIMAVSYFPYLTYSIPAIAGAFMLMPLVELGKRWSAAAYLASVLPVFLFAENEAKLLYLLFLGYYPTLKAVFESIKSRVIEYILKFLCFNGAIAAFYYASTYIFMIDLGETPFGRYTVLVLLVLANIAFVLYDICLTRLCGFYMFKLHSRIKSIFRH